MTHKAEPVDDRARLAASLRGVAADLDRIEGNQGWLASLRFGVAGGLAELGEGALAEAGFRRIVTETPGHLWSWIGLIDVSLARGDEATAAAIGLEALGYLPDEALLRRKTAEAVEAAHGPAAALAVLEVLAPEAMGADDAAYAVFLHRAAGTVTGAAALCARLLQIRPGDQLALLTRIEIGLHSGDSATALAAATDALTHHSDHAEIVLRAAQAHRQAGDLARATLLAEAAPPDPAFAPDVLSLRAMLAEDSGAPAAARRLWDQVLGLGLPNLTPVAQAALARLDEHVQGDPVTPPVQSDPAPSTLYADLDAALGDGADAVEAVLRRLVAHPDLPWYLAFRLVERLWHAGGVTEAERLSAAFDTARWSVTDRQAFAIEDLLLRRGPRTALDWVRAHPVARRDHEACERIGRVLIAGGAAHLAARYLAACCRRWPEDAQMLALATDALIASGQPDRLLRLIDGPCRIAPADQRLSSRVAGLVAQGDLTGAVAACTQARAAGGIRLPLIAMIELQVLTGDLAAAEACMSGLSVADGPLEEAVICRPRATRVGSLLNEARILAAAGLFGGDASSEDRSTAARDFYLPARSALMERSSGPLAQRDEHPETSLIPDLLHVIWPGSLPLPDEAERILDAWRAASRREVRLHDMRNAPAWLKERIDADAARAHAMAPEPEQKADLMMMGALLVDGGVAVVAHQWPDGDVDALFDRVTGAGIFLEGTGAVSMDVVIAAPGHPVIAAAHERAVASCLSRENDHRWFKTGPGLMTRVLASCLSDPLQASCPVTLRPIDALRAVISPHRVWMPPNAALRRSRDTTAFVTAIDRLLTARTGTNTASP